MAPANDAEPFDPSWGLDYASESERDRALARSPRRHRHASTRTIT